MTATIRRTAKITKPAKKAEYKGTVLVRVYDKKTGAVLGYIAKPSKTVDAKGVVLPWYQITCDNKGEWHCTCEGNAKWHRQCMHIDAAMEICAIRVEQGRPGCKPPMVAAPVAEETPAVETPAQPEQVKAAEEVAPVAEESYKRVEIDEEAKVQRWTDEELTGLSIETSKETGLTTVTSLTGNRSTTIGGGRDETIALHKYYQSWSAELQRQNEETKAARELATAPLRGVAQRSHITRWGDL